MDGNMKRKVGVGVIALLGFITTIKLAMIYYDANFNPYALPSFCSVSDLIDCDGLKPRNPSSLVFRLRIGDCSCILSFSCFWVRTSSKISSCLSLWRFSKTRWIIFLRSDFWLL